MLQGRKPQNAHKMTLISSQIELEGRPLPVQSAEEPFLFRCHNCRHAQHYKVLNVHSVNSLANLLCYCCYTREELTVQAAMLGRGAPRKLSDGEESLIRDIMKHGVRGWHGEFVHQMCPFTKTDKFKGSVDIVMFEGTPSARPGAAKACALLVYWDGSHHLRSEEQYDIVQARTDQKISTWAAQEGYCIVRIAKTDRSIKMQVLDAAWAARSLGTGWVKVSPRWNSAHLVPELCARCAGDCLEEDRPAKPGHSGLVLQLGALAQRCLRLPQE